MAKSQMERMARKLAAICFHSRVDSRHTVSENSCDKYLIPELSKTEGIFPTSGGLDGWKPGKPGVYLDSVDVAE